MFGIGKRKTKAQIEFELNAANRELCWLREQHRALVARTAYYQNLATGMGNQVQTWMQMHEELLKQLSAETPDLSDYVRSVAQTIRESYPDPASLIAAVVLSHPTTQGSFTASPSRGESGAPICGPDARGLAKIEGAS